MRSPEDVLESTDKYLPNNHGSSFNTLKVSTVSSPPRYRWSLILVKDAYPKFNFLKAPNRFHRFMQRIAFGFHWSRIDQDKK